MTLSRGVSFFETPALHTESRTNKGAKMENILEFKNVVKKKNRQNRNLPKKKKISSEKIWTLHFEERRLERNVSKSLVIACLNKGKRIFKNNAYHYILNNLYVVVDYANEVLVTVYFKSDFTNEEMLLAA